MIGEFKKDAADPDKLAAAIETVIYNHIFQTGDFSWEGDLMDRAADMAELIANHLVAHGLICEQQEPEEKEKPNDG